MRDAFARAVAATAVDGDSVFLTGDLGFMALEPVQRAFGDRFINVGVAEQNMVSVAAGIARTGMRVYAYSIASFASLRAVEQMKIDVAAQGLPVCVVGNGGGYAYGTMGPTHHALDDIAVMNAIGVQACVPAFDDDIGGIVSAWQGPTYLRLGYQELDPPTAPTAVRGSMSLRPLLEGQAGHVIALGPLSGVAAGAFGEWPRHRRPTVWACTHLPLGPLPAVLAAVNAECPVAVFEEHVQAGGLGHQLAFAWVTAGRVPRMAHRGARGYPSGRYGSQAFHRRECGLDSGGMVDAWQRLVSTGSQSVEV